ncbi:MAG TPA: long-chain fatty acid--CoA ligase [Desulfobacteraceae bacterium]|nr:long-chain fatty acid--CoA ligase [Desulfobacteraceae bacterium]
MDLIEFLKTRADAYGKKVLLLDRKRTVTYREFDSVTDNIAYGLEKLGIGPGDHVAVMHPNDIEVLCSYYGIIKAGAVVIPVNTIYTPREIEFILSNSDAKALIVHENLVSTVRKIHGDVPAFGNMIVRTSHGTVEESLVYLLGTALKECPAKKMEADDPAIIFYTSGTTGKPKGVVLTHRNFCFGGPNIAQNYGLREGDRTLAVLPMVHVFSVASPFFGSLSSGGSIVVLNKFKTDYVLEAIQAHGVTWFPGVPTMFTYLLNDLGDNHDVSSLRMGLSGGASLPVEVLKKWEERFEASIIEVYGLTESTGLVTANPVYGIRKPGSIGITVSGVQARLVDSDDRDVAGGEIGHLIFKGPNATKEYYKLPEETNTKIRDGWIYTGDHAYRDEEGYFYIAGREKELIISGGYNIYPREIEEVLHRYPGVNEAAVIGVSDPVKGEIPKAFVSVIKGMVIEEKDLEEYCKSNLAPYKRPRIVFMEELPKNTTGKIMKKELPTD